MLETILTTIAVVLILFALILGVNIISLLSQKIREMRELRDDHIKLLDRYSSLVRNYDELTAQYTNCNKKILAQLEAITSQAKLKECHKLAELNQ